MNAPDIYSKYQIYLMVLTKRVVKAFKACFDAEYKLSPGEPDKPATELIFMIKNLLF